MTEQLPNITVIGGGAGTRAILTGLKPHPVNLSAVVNMADNGGSSGVLREEFGVLPPGDVRQAIGALSDAPELVDLLDYRYPAGSPLAGHSVGNLLLAGAELRCGDFETALAGVSRMMGVKGQVIASTQTPHDLIAKINGDEQVRGEYEIAQAAFNPLETPPSLWLEPDAALHPRAEEAIARADLIVMAPGDLYGSLVPPLLLNGMRSALEAARAEVVYVGNLVNKPHQTAGFTALDYARELERLLGAEFIDCIMYNDGVIPEGFLEAYGKPGEEVTAPLAETSASVPILAGADLVNRNPRLPSDPEAITRSYIRHDPGKLAATILAHLRKT